MGLIGKVGEGNGRERGRKGIGRERERARGKGNGERAGGEGNGRERRREKVGISPPFWQCSNQIFYLQKWRSRTLSLFPQYVGVRSKTRQSVLVVLAGIGKTILPGRERHRVETCLCRGRARKEIRHRPIYLYWAACRLGGGVERNLTRRGKLLDGLLFRRGGNKILWGRKRRKILSGDRPA